MNARLCSLLVAGGVTLVATQGSHLYAATAGMEIAHRTSTLQGVNLEEQAGKAVRLILDIPGFQGTPKIQLLTGPDRVVVDLPGVLKGAGINRKDLLGIDSTLVVRSRIAQFSTLPEPVTRLVFETQPGVRIQVSSSNDRISLMIESEQESRPAPKPLPVANLSEVGRVIESEDVIISSYIIPFEPFVQTQRELIALSSPKLPVVLTEVAPVSVLGSIPSLGSNPSSFPVMGLASLMPATVPTAPALLAAQTNNQEARKDVATNPVKQAGRTLGDPASKYTGAKMSIDVQGADLITFLRILADAGKLNLIVDQDVQGSYSFKFTDTPWDQILDLVLKNAGLGKDLQNGVLRVAKVEKLQKEEHERKSLDEAKSLAGETQSVTRSLSYAKAGEAKPILEKVLTKRGSVILDERTNTLIISDLPKNLPLVDDLLATLDVQIQQVQIEAKVVEASDGYEKAFGVKWPTNNSGDAKLSFGSTGTSAPWGFGQSWNSASNKSDGTTNPLGVAFSGGKDGITSIAGAAGEAWVSFISERFSVNFILQALEKEGKVKIVSSPKLVTQNNKKAKILSGEKIPYPSQQGGAAGGAITVAFADANLELNVTPQITSDGTIIMDIKIEKAEADFSRTVQGSPTILRREIETQVLVRDGGTAVLGGVYSTNKATGFAGIPFLSKLPIIGGLFRTRSNKDQNAELLIFITPRIIKN